MKILKKFLKGGVNILTVIINIAIGIIIGYVISRSVLHLKTIGKLRLANSDPDEEPYLFLELSKDISMICKKKYVVLRINSNDFIPRK